LTAQNVIDSLQDYLRDNARRQYQTLVRPPFTLFLHPSSRASYWNYAIPDENRTAWPRPALDLLQTAFHQRERTPRFEFIAEYAPTLAPALRRIGFFPESSNPLMLCTRDEYHPAVSRPELEIQILDCHAPVATLRQFLETQQSGFGLEYEPPLSDADVAAFVRQLGDGRALLARLESCPVAVAVLATPLDQTAEIMGVATLPPHRRRGFASTLTSILMELAFAAGVQRLVLSADNKEAGRLYQRLGFAPCATLLAFRKD
jgi:ribosomal protein S18 acetylase RimI-like enzyme